MAITTSGGSGSGTQAVVSTGTNFSIFTTPNTANTIFVITWFICGDKDTGFLSCGGNPVAQSSNASYYFGSEGHSNSGVIKAGPNTTIYLSAISSAAATTKWTYNWVGITFS